MGLLLVGSFGCTYRDDRGGEVVVESRRAPGGHGGPPPHAPAHGYRAKHRYRYYPDAHVYYDTGRGVWFWWEAGKWRVGARLPQSIHTGSDWVRIEMNTDRPYVEHDRHRQKYPPGQAKKNKKKDWKQ
jgi:hypothetical protein